MPAVAVNHRVPVAVLICGTLDIAYAAGQVLLGSGDVARMLRTVASGPFGSRAGEWGLAGALAGLGVHFAIMAVMVIVYAGLVRLRAVKRVPWELLGLAYGSALYVVMYRIVLPLRWPGTHPLHDPGAIFWSLLPHLACVGLPMAWILRRT